MSDHELLDACTLLPWERGLHRFVWSGVGCAAGLVMFAIPPVLVYLLRGGVRGAGASAAVAAVTLIIPALWAYFGVHSLAVRRRNRYWHEIKRRFAGLETKHYLRDVESRAMTGSACVVLTGAALPHGGAWLVRAWLYPGGTGRVERRSLRPSYLVGETAQDIEVESGDAPLEAEEAEALRVLINEAVAHRGRIVHSEARDGAPAEVAVWAWELGVVKTGRCNLAGVPANREHLPVVRLMRRVWELGRKVPGDGQPFGSFNSTTGAIQLGEV